MSTTSLPAPDMRERVFAQVDDMARVGRPLGVGAPLDSTVLHSDGNGRWSLDRARLHMEWLEPYRHPAPGISVGGRSAVVTAGPPGAGKSTVLADVLDNISAWRRIDADEFKKVLVGHAALHDLSTYGPSLSRVLRDGKPVMPLELAGLFHQESTMLADRALAMVLANGEDVVIEGTLAYPPLAEKYAVSIARAGYDSITIVDLPTPRCVALERAKSRWWEGRLLGGLGGRFTPSDAFDRMFDASGGSLCSVNADALAARAEGLDLETRLFREDPPPPLDAEETA